MIAPVARYSGVWKIPVLTSGAQADAFRYKMEHYQTLTRMMGSYGHVGEAFITILQNFNWKVAGLLYHNYAPNSSKGNSVCHFTLGAIFTALNQTPIHRSFDEESRTVDYKELLHYISTGARSKFYEFCLLCDFILFTARFGVILPSVKHRKIL